MNKPLDPLSAIATGPDACLMEIVELTARDDERVWIREPGTAVDVWWRPLMFDLANGNHVELMRVRRGGSLGRHLHATPVHGFVLKGRWRYVEKPWVAEPGAYVYEPAGDVHSLVCDEAEEMITLFHIHGPIIYVDEADKVMAIDDNRELIRRAREHYTQVGLGAGYVDRLFR